MAKYRAKDDFVHPYKTGDIVEFKDPLTAGFASHFESAPDDAELTDVEARNPLRDPTAAGTQLNTGGKLPTGEKQETGDEGSEDVTTTVVNPSREELKARAKELDIDFAPNITTERLLELVQAKEAELKAAE